MLLLRDLLAFQSPLRLAILSTIVGLLARPSTQQTYSSCDPLDQSDCHADPALGKSISIDLTSGASSEFTPQGSPAIAYSSTNGGAFTVSTAGDAPQINSNWYIMFGRYEVTMKVAPGDGIVSSIVLESDDLDEIDWEFLGATPTQGQTNYFGKGQTTTYDRGGISTVAADTEGAWHVYGVEWTSEQIVWSVDGQAVRTLAEAEADGQFPQTPCRLKIGVWSAGDPSNAPGTISWAHGPTDYSDGPFTMYVSSIMVQDYSTGTEYKYGDTSGEWESIEAVGGTVSGTVAAGGGSSGAGATASNVPTATAAVPGISGVPGTTVTSTNYPGLPTGWTVNPSTGKVVPPSAAPGVEVPLRSACVSILAVLGSLMFGAWL